MLKPEITVDDRLLPEMIGLASAVTIVLVGPSVEVSVTPDFNVSCSVYVPAETTTVSPKFAASMAACIEA